MRKLIVANIVSVDGFYSGPNDDVMAMPFDTPFSVMACLSVDHAPGCACWTFGSSATRNSSWSATRPLSRRWDASRKRDGPPCPARLCGCLDGLRASEVASMASARQSLVSRLPLTGGNAWRRPDGHHYCSFALSSA